ncbi:popeye domain-containing protein 3-like [Pollicipes pollicipes]|uniref:popeye domain-containing protein 3-like n=1 Tax=Pollicipes pollicipes TaxID=41117 RepID=UPI001884CA88|nr:popeye domain-containing protein 3-like [Pollicipes pollicipes]XP_037082609.1 popeye domain-containing protein 3-like [Pollicipes pollicipes]
MSALPPSDVTAVTGWRNVSGEPNDTLTTLQPPDAAGYVICPSYLPLNHVYFQVANFFLFLSYLAPPGLGGLLYLRSTLAIGLFFLAMWGYVVLCALDTFLWNFVCMWINLGHVGYLLWTLRPIRFDKDMEQVYSAMFRSLNVSRRQFQRVLSCMRGVRSVSFQEMLIQEHVTRVDSLTLVLSGRFVVSQGGKALHVVAPDQFLDSPEWFSVLTDDFFQVSITAIEESRVLVWHRDKLKLSIMGEPFLQAVFDNVLGRDVVQKLLQVDRSFSLGDCPSNGGTLNILDRHSALMLVQRTDQGAATTASDQTGQEADESAWRLGPIDENMKGGTRV